MTTKTVSQNHAWRRWRMKLRQLTQLTVYEHFGLVNMRAINTGGGVYWTGGRLPALSPARPLWTWRMELRQLTMNAHLRSVSICAYRGLPFCMWTTIHHVSCIKFGEHIPTGMEVIESQTLNFKPNFKFSRLFFFGGGPPSHLRCALGSIGESLARVKI